MKTTTFLTYCCIPFVSYLIYLFVVDVETTHPVILWWTDFGVQEEIIVCSQKKCIVGSNPEHVNNKHLKAFMFYGSFLDLNNLPNRHNADLYWALFHEESPKNQPALQSPKLQQLFNITSTFSRHSTFPITLQYLKSASLLTSDEYFINVQEKNDLMKVEKLSPVLYIQSACDTPINRDSYVRELMRYVKVDSYGACLNNKKLPDELTVENQTLEFYSDPLLKLSAKYKFIVAIENARCNDYITEKLWRPLIVGAIPIYLGANTIKDYLPNPKSAVLIDDFPTIEKLAEHITVLNENDGLYNSYMNHKLKRQLVNDRLLNAYKSGGSYGQADSYDDVIPAFQCFVCNAAHAKRSFPPNTRNVYDCAYPEDESWHYSWKQGEQVADELL